MQDDLWYKGAVSEEIAYGGGATGGYMVLLQGERSTQSFHINKDEEGLWEHEELSIPHELVFK